MYDCQRGRGVTFSVNPHAGILIVNFYVLGNSHLSGRQCSVIGNFSVGAVGPDQAALLIVNEPNEFCPL